MGLIMVFSGLPSNEFPGTLPGKQECDRRYYDAQKTLQDAKKPDGA
jgi:hypothetical protein